jgi:hypothetical protein
MRKTLVFTGCFSLAIFGWFAGERTASADGWRGRPAGQFPAGPPHGPPATPRGPATQAPHPHAQPARAPAPPPRGPAFRPHVDARANWVGHEPGPRNQRYFVRHPWPHGHFAGPIGAGHVYRVSGFYAPRHRFWFGRSAFVVAEPDWQYVDDWDWNADQIVLYDDPDDDGWYLAYNTRLGAYVHVTFDGPL